MFGSVLTVGRELVSDYQQWDAADIALADYISENAESDALFLTSDSHLTPVFALAGRRHCLWFVQLGVFPRHGLRG